MLKETVTDSAGKVLALIVTNRKPAIPEQYGIEFLGDPGHVMQVGVMRRPSGHEFKAHRHLPVARAMVGTPEVLFIREGWLSADFYDDAGTRMWS